MPDLTAEKEATDRKYKAAKAIVKWLRDFTPEDAAQVLRHVGVEMRMAVTIDVPKQAAK